MQMRNQLARHDFIDVIQERIAHRVQNTGFIKEGVQVFTYTQDKQGLNYFYCKQIVLDDGINTTFLDI